MTTKSRRNRTRPETEVGFRLLDSANNINNYYLSVVNYEPPEPPRVPEPYKLASSTMARAHRKSSFVIIAETEEGTTKSQDGSPVRNGRVRSARSRSPLSPSRAIRGGRASPFRPRGFKGPPPHAQSRPPSPPPAIHRRRFIKPKSLSQGNSPRKQSLIPQPRAGLTTMKSKIDKPERERWERRGSRKFTHLPRASSMKAQQPVRRPLIEASRPPAKGKSPKTVTKLPKQAMKSPTKIPVRNPLSNNRFVKLSNDSSRLKKEDVPQQHLRQQLQQPKQQLPAAHVPLPPKHPPSDSSPLVTDESVIMACSGMSDNSLRRAKEEDNLGLIDLLKQSSGASGTSSVVNAATATAVQPLRIDATILPTPVLDKKDQSKANISNSSVAAGVACNMSNATGGKREASPVILEKKEGERSQTVTAVAAVEPVKPEVLQTVSAKSISKPTTSKDEVNVDRDEPRVPLEVEAVPAKVLNQLKQVNSSNQLDTSCVIDESQKTRNGSKPQSTRTSPHSMGTRVELEESEKRRGNQVQVQGSTAKEKLRNHGSEASLKSSKSNDLSTGSVESIRSTDTGVSLNTVRGVSSAREKRGMHTVKRENEIETLSGNVRDFERSGRAENGEPAVVDNPADKGQEKLAATGRFGKWRSAVRERFGQRWTSSRMGWLGGRNRKAEAMQRNVGKRGMETPSGVTRWARFRNAFCRGFRWGTKVAPSETSSCCRPERTCGFFCNRNWCRLPSCACCRRCNCCRRSSDTERTRNIRAKHSLTSVAPPPLSEAQKSKLPEVLVEHNSVMRGAIPCLPVPLAWFCLVWNVLVPGTGTIWSGLFNLCVGQPRFSPTASGKSRFGALIVNIIVGVSQAFTVLFCLVGWGWSIWWAVTMIRLARKWKRFKAAEATNGDAEARGPEGVLPAPGVPTQALRGVERAR